MSRAQYFSVQLFPSANTLKGDLCIYRYEEDSVCIILCSLGFYIYRNAECSSPRSNEGFPFDSFSSVIT